MVQVYARLEFRPKAEDLKSIKKNAKKLGISATKYLTLTHLLADWGELVREVENEKVRKNGKK